MSVKEHDQGEQPVVVRLAGEIDLFSVADIEVELLVKGRESGDRSLVLDLTDVTFVDLAALRVLTAASKRFKDVVLLNPPPMARRVLALTHMDAVVAVRCG